MLRTSLCQRNKARGIMTWYARIFDTDDKSVRYESLGTTRKTEAHDLMTAKTQAGEFNRKSEKDTLSTGDAFQMYLDNLEMKGVHGDSLSNAEDVFRSLRSIYHVPVVELTKKTLLDAFVEANAGLSAGTYNMRKTYVKSAFKFFVNVLELIPSNIAEVIPARKNNARERDFWTIEQIERILDAAPEPRFRLMWSLMAFAGLRIHEALKVKKEDFKEGFLYVVGKGNKPAKIPVSTRLLSELDRVGWEWDFSHSNRQSHTLRRTALKAIPEGFHGTANNHRLRHSFASNLIRSGVGVKQVQKLMRHSNITTTLQIYSHLLDEDLNDSVEKMFKK